MVSKKGGSGLAIAAILGAAFLLTRSPKATGRIPPVGDDDVNGGIDIDIEIARDRDIEIILPERPTIEEEIDIFVERGEFVTVEEEPFVIFPTGETLTPRQEITARKFGLVTPFTAIQEQLEAGLKLPEPEDLARILSNISLQDTLLSQGVQPPETSLDSPQLAEEEMRLAPITSTDLTQLFRFGGFP